MPKQRAGTPPIPCKLIQYLAPQEFVAISHTAAGNSGATIADATSSILIQM
jgi:hypothetical protein